MLRWPSAIFQVHFYRPTCSSEYLTTDYSSPGPCCSLKIKGYQLENVGFLIPTIGLTAVGLTVLSYNNKLHLGITADDSTIDNEDDLHEILQGMKREIEAMMIAVR
jgi:hypothetical protein